MSVHAQSRGRRLARSLDAVGPALVPLGWLYALGVSVVRGARRAGVAEAPACHVVSVGNLVVGGAGKTPLSIALAREARRRGLRVAWVSRGFRSRAERAAMPTVVPAAGDDPMAPAGARVVRRDHPDLADEIGDEAAMVARRLPDVPLVVGRDKARALVLADEALAVAVAVVDDAFQSWSMPRDVDVVVVDAERPFADGRLVPAGRLREEPTALARAHVVLFGGAPSREALAAVRACAGRDAFVGVLERTVGWVDGRLCDATAPDGDVVVASGIASPEAFERAVREAAPGARVVACLRFADHHRYDRDDVRRIEAAAQGRTLVTTEKDWVKLSGRVEGADVRVARVDVRVPEAACANALKPRREAAASALRYRRIETESNDA